MYLRLLSIVTWGQDGTFCKRRTAASLCAVLRALKELFFQSFHGGRRLFNEGHEAVFATLWPHFLWQCHQTVVAYILNGTVGKLSPVRKRSQDEEAALEILNALRILSANTSTSKEVDDAFLQDIRGEGLFSLLVFFNSLRLRFDRTSRLVILLFSRVLRSQCVSKLLSLYAENLTADSYLAGLADVLFIRFHLIKRAGFASIVGSFSICMLSGLVVT